MSGAYSPIDWLRAASSADFGARNSGSSVTAAAALASRADFAVRAVAVPSSPASATVLRKLLSPASDGDGTRRSMLSRVRACGRGCGAGAAGASRASDGEFDSDADGG